MTHGWITPDDDTFDSMRANQIARWLYRLTVPLLRILAGELRDCAIDAEGQR